jgi:hypothetical protein
MTWLGLRPVFFPALNRSGVDAEFFSQFLLSKIAPFAKLSDPLAQNEEFLIDQRVCAPVFEDRVIAVE